jgi:hypothetical protein
MGVQVQVLRSLSACENISYAPRDFGRPADGLLTLANFGGIGKDFAPGMFVAGPLVMNTAMAWLGGGTFSASVRALRAFSLKSQR